MQQLLPFTVLKPANAAFSIVDTGRLQQLLPFTVLKPAIVTIATNCFFIMVATALTVYGIETLNNAIVYSHIAGLLQQLLPFTVLKRLKDIHKEISIY